MALERVVLNLGAAGIDGMPVEELRDYMNANWQSIKESILARESLLELQDEAVLVLARKIRYARKQGYLKDYLKQVNMLEILYLEKEKQDGRKAGLKAVPKVHMVARENRDSAQIARDREMRLQRFKLIK